MNVVKMIFGLIYLYYKMGNASIIGFLVVSIMIYINMKIARKIGSYFEQMIEHRDERLKLTTAVVIGIRALKFLSWEEIFQNKIMKIRDKEFSFVRKAKYLDALCVYFWATTTIIITTITFKYFEYTGHELNS